MSDQIKKTLWQVRRGDARHKHPVNQMMVEDATFGERIADKIASGIGSWTFIITQTIIVVAWMTVNVVEVV
jgi:uncharacterized membrane protein